MASLASLGSKSLKANQRYDVGSCVIEGRRSLEALLLQGHRYRSGGFFSISQQFSFELEETLHQRLAFFCETFNSTSINFVGHIVDQVAGRDGGFEAAQLDVLIAPVIAYNGLVNLA